MPVSKQQEAMISDMSKRGMDVDTISSITGVSTQDVQDTISSQQTTPNQVNEFGPIEGIRSIDNINIPSASRYGGERAQIGFSTPISLESIGVPSGYGTISVNNPLANPNMFAGVRSLEDLSRALDPSLSIEAQNLAGIQGLRARMDYDLFGKPTFGINYNTQFGGPKRPDLSRFLNIDRTNPYGLLESFEDSMAGAATFDGGFRDDSETGYDSTDIGGTDYGGGVTGGGFGE